MSDWYGELLIIAVLCGLSFCLGMHAQKHKYRDACGDILVSYTDGYRDCKAGR